MKSQVQILDPLRYPRWDGLVLSCEGYSFFHSSNWARVLSASYGYRPLYFVCLADGELLSLIPVMEIRSLLTGKRGVSLPFTDYCKPLTVEKGYFDRTLNRIIEFGKEEGWDYLELRGVESGLEGEHPSLCYHDHTLDLTQGVENRFSNFRDSTKRNIKRAIKEGVKVKIESSLDSIKEFYRLNCLTRKHHGLPPQPWIFFRRIYEHVLDQDLGLVVLALSRGKTIAGSVFFHFGEKAIYKYGASDRRYQSLRANNLVMWEAIKHYAQCGYKSLSLGRTEPENRGLLQFKDGWGGEKRIVNYYKYSLKKGAYVRGKSPHMGFHTEIFRRTPLSLLNIIGRALYKHMG